MKRNTLNKGAKFFIAILLLTSFWTTGFFLIQSFKKNLEYYLSPSEALKSNDRKEKIRIGGLIVKGSIETKNSSIVFKITDFEHEIIVTYTGHDLPPIFKEGIGIIARGYLIDNNNFLAEQLIGKHDENYRPKIINPEKHIN